MPIRDRTLHRNRKKVKEPQNKYPDTWDFDNSGVGASHADCKGSLQLQSGSRSASDRCMAIGAWPWLSSAPDITLKQVRENYGVHELQNTLSPYLPDSKADLTGFFSLSLADPSHCNLQLCLFGANFIIAMDVLLNHLPKGTAWGFS